MTLDEAKATYLSISRGDQARFLASFGHELTVAARFTYDPGSEDVADPQNLRKYNEILHRVLDCIGVLVSNSDDTLLDYWDSAIVETVFL